MGSFYPELIPKLKDVNCLFFSEYEWNSFALEIGSRCCLENKGKWWKMGYLYSTLNYAVSCDNSGVRPEGSWLFRTQQIYLLCNSASWNALYALCFCEYKRIIIIHEWANIELRAQVRIGAAQYHFLLWQRYQDSIPWSHIFLVGPSFIYISSWWWSIFTHKPLRRYLSSRLA